MLQARKERGGGVAPRRNNRITESATKESREAIIEESDTRIERKTARRKDKNERKKHKGWDTENENTRGKEEKKEKNAVPV